MLWLLLLPLAGLLCALGMWMALPARRRDIPQEAARAFLRRNIAHRGLHDGNKMVPENSLAAFAKAADAGYAIELDIQPTAEGEIVVFHDESLQRMCGVDARVEDSSLATVQALRLAGTGERAPLFSEVLALVAGRVPLLVELKPCRQRRLLCETAHAMLKDYSGAYCVESFDPRIVGWFRRRAPGVLRGQLSARPSVLGRGPAAFAVGWLFTNCIARPHFIAYGKGWQPPTVRFARKRTLRFLWTVRPGDNVARLQAENDGLIFEGYAPGIVYN